MARWRSASNASFVDGVDAVSVVSFLVASIILPNARYYHAP